MLKSMLIGVLLALPVASQAAAPAPTGLEAIAAAYPGSWKVETENYSSEFSQAGSRTYSASRECWKSGEALKCVVVVDDKLAAELVFTYDPTTDTCHEHQILTQGSPAEMTITIKGDTWTYVQDSKAKDGSIVQFRITRVYKKPDSIEFKQEFRHVPGDWITMSSGTEMRTKPDNQKP